MDEQNPKYANCSTTISSRFLIISICVLITAFALYWAFGRKPIIGATADVIESQSGFTLKARVDTGASICSLHCKTIEIADAEDEPERNSGKKARFLLEGPNGEQRWLEATVLGFAGVRNASGASSRYRVRLTLTCRGVTKNTIVSLNDRSEMKYPLLLGRDYLKGNFVVDVSLDNPDYP